MKSRFKLTLWFQTVVSHVELSLPTINQKFKKAIFGARQGNSKICIETPFPYYK